MPWLVTTIKTSQALTSQINASILAIHSHDQDTEANADDWPRSASKKEWFRITRELIQSVIADMDLDPASLSQVEEAFISAGLL